MLKFMKKTRTATIASVLMLTIAATFMACLPVVNAAEATFAFMSIDPNPVGVGQSVIISVWLHPFPRGRSDVYHGLVVTITKPDNGVETLGPATSYTSGQYWWSYVPATVGTYYFKFVYPGETFATITRLGSETQKQALVVQQEPIPQWPAAELPTGYWTRPIDAQNREWYAIAGNWLTSGYNASSGVYDSANGFNPYTTAPRAPHVVWTKGAALGGLVGGEYGSANYYYPFYEQLVTPPIVINGILYYRLTLSSAGDMPGNYPGFAAVDLRTGEELWRVTNGTITCGQLYNSRGANGQGVTAFLWDTSGTTWTVYDAWSGQVMFKFSGARSTPKVVFGPNGDLYAYFYQSRTTAPWLAMWNATRAWERLGWMAMGTLRPYRPGTFDWKLGIQWNITEPDLPAPVVIPSTWQMGWGTVSNVIFGSATPGTSEGGYTWSIHVGYDARTGAQLWVENRTTPGGTAWRRTYGQGVYVQFDPGKMSYYCWDIQTGRQKWISDPADYPWGSYYWSGTIAYNKLYVGGYDGYERAWDINTGKQVWEFYSGDSGLETPYGTWPMVNGPIVGDGVVFCGNSEHTASTPLYRGESLFALDAQTGKLMWKINGWLSLRALVDGYLVTFNGYDRKIYVLGKGPSATTVSAPQTLVPSGTGVLITGSVTDQSPGAKDTPAIADANMSAWMEYLYMQKPIPMNVNGVPVLLQAMRSDGSIIDIGSVYSDATGQFSYCWTPPAPGTYKICASFLGSDSYGSSAASTFLSVGPAPEAPAEEEAAVMPDYTPMFAGIIIAVIVTICLVLYTLYTVRKQRK